MHLSHRPLSPTVLAPDGRLTSRSYALIEEIGRGATGTVWRARAVATGREYAIKILHGDQCEEPKAVARFLQERAILLRLRHENLVAVHDLLATTDGSPALVLDLVTGGTLRDLLRERGTLPPAEAAGLLAQVAAGLTVAHEAGVVHRDLKPDNILLAPTLDGGIRPRLTDFGIARVLDEPRLTTTGAVLGTPNYMAPEVIEGRPATVAADIYALGILFYELLTGRPPFADSSDTAVLLRHVRAAVQKPDGIPPRVWALIEACLHRNAKRRPAARTLTRTLRRLAAETEGLPALPPRPADDATTTFVLAEEDAPRPPRPPVPRPRTEPGRRRTTTSAVAMVAAAVLAVGGYAAIQVTGLNGPDTGRSGGAATQRARPGEPATSAAAPAPAPHASAVAPPVEYQVGSAVPRPESVERILPALPAPGEVFGPWQCATYRWALAHLMLAKACQATGDRVRMIGTLKTAPGMKADASLLIRDADTEEVVAGPFQCPGLTFSEQATERSCGPFDVNLERGHRYQVVEQWKYSDASMLPGGTVTGDPFAW